MVHRIVAPINAERLQRLDALEARPDGPSVEALLDAFIGPILDLLDCHVEQGRMIARLLLRLFGDPGGAMQRIAFAEVNAVADRFYDAFARALPHLPPDELWWRLTSVIAVVTFHNPFALSQQTRPDFTAGFEAEGHAWMKQFLATGLQAPATPRRGDD